MTIPAEPSFISASTSRRAVVGVEPFRRAERSAQHRRARGNSLHENSRGGFGLGSGGASEATCGMNRENSARLIEADVVDAVIKEPRQLEGPEAGSGEGQA